jgi:hypothetical protein
MGDEEEAPGDGGGGNPNEKEDPNLHGTHAETHEGSAHGTKDARRCGKGASSSPSCLEGRVVDASERKEESRDVVPHEVGRRDGEALETGIARLDSRHRDDLEWLTAEERAWLTDVTQAEVQRAAPPRGGRRIRQDGDVSAKTERVVPTIYSSVDSSRLGHRTPSRLPLSKVEMLNASEVDSRAPQGGIRPNDAAVYPSEDSVDLNEEEEMETFLAGLDALNIPLSP